MDNTNKTAMSRLPCLVAFAALAFPVTTLGDTIAMRGINPSAILVPGISAGGRHTCAMPNSGGVICWGQNNYGQLGDGTTTNRQKAVPVYGLNGSYFSISAGETHTCVVTDLSGVKCWGNNNNGQLGDGSLAVQHVPVDVAGLSNIGIVSAGFDHSCAVTNDGAVMCWGGNAYGQLGNGSNVDSTSPVDVIGLQSGVTTVAAGAYYSCALLDSGSVKCWGYNGQGQLGDGTQTNRPTPVDVSGLTSGVGHVSVNLEGYHTCADMVSTTAPQVKCWGDNSMGAFGNGTATSSTTPVDVPSTQDALESVMAYVGYQYSCFRWSIDFVKCSGSNAFGQLGDGTGIDSLVPVDVAGIDHGIQAMTIGFRSACVVRNSELRCWGLNLQGELGDATLVNRFSPVPARRERVDFNADGNADIVWRNSSDGSLLQWLMSGTNAVQQTSLGGPGSTAVPTHIADFNGDGKADILWRDADGSVTMTLMDGGNVVASAMLVGPGTGWSVTHVGDFNADGMADLIWTHTDGSVQMWIMSGTTPAAVAGFVGAGSGWSVSRVVDLNGDGFDDIIWQHTDGTVLAWLMDGNAVSAIASFAAAGSGWSIALSGDFDGDGINDLLWTHADGSVQIWLMGPGLTVKQVNSVVPAGTGWVPTHTGDLDGDGHEDILWHYPDGTVLIWLMGNANNVNQVASVTGAGNQYAITHARDLDGDGKADLLWQAPDGTVQAWLMNGTAVNSITQITGPGPYSIVP